jgi:threonine/homoserine/homoserine lactone efflux protein
LIPAFFLQGLAVGFSIAAPVGPIGLLCIQRSLAGGRISGLISGLGAATADAVYGSIAAFGIASVSIFLVDQQTWIRLVGGLFLIFLGMRIYRKAPSDSAMPAENGNLFGDYASTFVLTLSNPLTVISFAAIFAGLGLAGAGGDYAAAVAVVSGVFSGSALWWVILSVGVGSFRARLRSGGMRWVNRVSGAVLVTFGLVALLSLVV